MARTLEEQTEHDELLKKADEMRASFRHRSLRQVSEPDEIEKAFVARQRHRLDSLADLVGSESWTLLKELMAEILSLYHADPPRSVDGRIAWETFNTARDVLDKVVNTAEEAANHGKKNNIVEEKEISI